MKAARYARDRDAAFVAFVEDGDFAHIDRLMARYGLPPFPHTREGRAAVLKAVQGCASIPRDTKAKAARECLRLGFSPYVKGGEKWPNAR